MIFSTGWFLHKMNKYAPNGYKFVVIGDEGRIAMYNSEIMGPQSPRGPFVSKFSFDMLDCVYGGLMTRRSSYISQGAPAGEYLYAYEIARPTTPTVSDQKYNMFRSVIHQHMQNHSCPYLLMARKNAILVQGMQDANANAPEFLTARLNKYINACTWRAIERVMSSMPICDMKYYQEQYQIKMNELGIVHMDRFGGLNTNKIAIDKRYEDLCSEIEKLTYDILPKQTKALERATAKEQPAEKLQVLQKQVATTKDKLSALTAERASLETTPAVLPARQMLPAQFFDNGEPIVPTLSQNPCMQMIQLMFMRETKNKTK